MNRIKLKTKRNTEKIIVTALKLMFSIAFLTTWFYLVYHMIFIY